MTSVMSNPKSRWAVGLISGTSMDGIDAALVRLGGPVNRPTVRLRAFRTISYPPKIREALMGVADGGFTTAGEISRLNFIVGERCAAAALSVCRAGGISPARVSVIGSHGQTIFHQGPERQARGAPGAPEVSSTLQIGAPAVIAERTGAPVVADFRTADVAAGGYGAPLVPMADYLLLRDVKRGVITLNLGGIANVAIIPGGARPGDVFGFDTGPGNMVVDALVRHFTGGRKHYDAGGRWANQGKVLEDLVLDALAFPFFQKLPPKSAGQEQFGDKFVRRYFLGRPGESAADLLRSATELTALSVAVALRNTVSNRGAYHRLIVSGGGAHNSLLMARLGDVLPGLELRLSDDFGIPADAKEAMAFALLADRTLQALPGNLPAVTGARRAVVLGAVWDVRT